MIPPDLVEVHRSQWRNDCEERSFVLHAVGIDSQVIWLGRAWGLVVPLDAQAAAQLQLERYERENPPRRRESPPEPLHARNSPIWEVPAFVGSGPRIM